MMVLLVLLLVLLVTRCHLWVSHWVPQRRTKYIWYALVYLFPVLHVQAITVISQGVAEC